MSRKSAVLWAGLGAMVAVAAISTKASAQTPMMVTSDARTIRVTGIGEVRTEPDLATVQFAVETTGASAQEAGQRNAELMERVISALAAAGVRREDIRTSGYNLFPEYAPQIRPGLENEPPRIRGYRASNQVAVRTTELGRLGGLIDAGLEAGANRLHGVYFELRDSQRAQAEALGRAVQDARTQAETIASALGVRLGAVLDASTTAEPVRPVYRVAMESMQMRDAAFAPPTPIEPGEQTVRAVASVVFEIER